MRIALPAAPLLAAILAFAAPAAYAAPGGHQTPPAPAPFLSLPSDHWAYRAFAILRERGMTAPPQGGAFPSARDMSRYEFAVGTARIIECLPVRRMEKSTAPTRETLFADAQLARLLEEFAPEIERLGVDIPTARTRLAPYLPAATEAIPRRFADVPEKHWAFDAVETARVLGILRGYPDGTF